jgi:hypothetical protein
MLTRSKTTLLQILPTIKSNIIQINSYMNLASIYYKSEHNYKNTVIKLCLNDEQLNKIKNKRIIIYNKEDYDYGELLGYEKIVYDENLVNFYNKNNKNIIKSIENNLLDDVIIEMLIDDYDIEASKILYNLKNNY